MAMAYAINSNHYVAYTQYVCIDLTQMAMAYAINSNHYVAYTQYVCIDL